MCPVCLFFFVLQMLAFLEANASQSLIAQRPIMKIGAVLDLNTRMGREQKIAMEIAVEEFNRLSCFNSKLVLDLKNSRGNSAQAVAAAMDLAHRKQVQAIIGTITQNEATLATKINNTRKNIPIISLSSHTSTDSLSTPLPYFIQVGDDITLHMQCIAAIVGSYRWQKVTPIYEYSNGFFPNPGVITLLFYSLRLVGSEIDHHLALPSLSSLSNPNATIEQELNRLKSKSNRIFLIVQSSLELATLLFEKAKEMGMMENGYVWIIPDGVAGFLDSVDSSVISNMQGVVGFKANFMETRETVRQFKFKFRTRFLLEYPEEENTKPSLFALLAYDAIWAIARAAEKSHAKFMQEEFADKILSSNFQGLSGKISFKDGKLLQSPTFDIINVIGRSYKELAFWSPVLGFSKNLIRHQLMEMKINNGSSGVLGTVYWPGGLLEVPNERTNNSNRKQPLRIGVPANGAFKQFVNVSYDQTRNQSSITGFSIDVFKAAVQRLPYQLSYVFVPLYGSYDEMVEQVYKKELDAAVGDTEIIAYRYQYVEFSQPYVESGLEMIVTVKPDKSKETWMFMQAFTKEMWLIMAAMHIFIGFVIWLIEREVNPELRGFGAMLWFLVTVLFYAHREQIRSPLARIVLTPWLFVILIATSSFTASLTSMLTISQLEPSILDVETLLRTNAVVGCNGNSFIVRYLIEALHFKPENIRRIASIRDYPAAFKNNDIKAAFFVGPHAKVFLSMYCKGYMKAGNTFKLGGFGYAFQKSSSLAVDMSVALLNLIESRVIEQLEKDILSNTSCPSSESKTQDGSSLGVQPFFGLFCICGVIAVLALLYSVKDLLARIVQNLMLRAAILAIQNQSYSKFLFRSKTRASPAPEANNNPQETPEQSPVGIQLVDVVMISHASNQVIP